MDPWFWAGLGAAILLLLIVAVTMLKTRWNRRLENRPEAGLGQNRTRVSGHDDD
jgi:hypothetical protein